MYQTESKNPIHLIETEGMKIVNTFKNFDDLVRNWDWIKKLYHSKNLGPSIKIVHKNNEWWINPCHYKYILRDSFGDFVDPKNVYIYHNNLTSHHSYWDYRIPGSKRSNRHYFRHPHTIQERRWNDAWNDEEDAPKGRPARNIHNLPSDWDDIPFSHEYRFKNWKKFRKTQYK